MRIFLIAIGQRMPNWIEQAYKEYSKRLSTDIKLELIEVASTKRTKNLNTQSIILKESEALFSAIPKNAHIVILDSHGEHWDTATLAQNLEKWRTIGQNIALLIGGPDGIAEHFKDQAAISWSLSKLTFPHPIVRVLIAEQLYRATCILKNHPYHK